MWNKDGLTFSTFSWAWNDCCFRQLSNSNHAVNKFKEESCVEWRNSNFRLIDLAREELPTMGLPAIFDDHKF